MVGMFWNATALNQPLNYWNVSNVTNMEWIFRNATSFNHSLHASWYDSDSDSLHASTMNAAYEEIDESESESESES